MTRPLLFLDVDGVLNCLDFNAGYDIVQPDPDGLAAMVPPGTREKLGAVLPLYDPVWATAWRGAAHMHFRDHLGLPAESWPHLDFLDLKLPVILRYAKGRPWAWVDDDAEYEMRELGPHFRDLPGTLTIVPDRMRGLTDEHVNALVSFAQSSP